MREGGSDEAEGADVPLLLGASLGLAAAGLESRRPERERRFCLLGSAAADALLLLLEEELPLSSELSLNLTIVIMFRCDVWFAI